MAINTIILDLSVDPQTVIQKIGLKSTIQEVLSKFIPELKEVYSSDFKDGGSLSTYTAARESFITVRGFPKGLVSINIEYYREDGDEPLLSFETVARLEATLTEQSGSVKSHKYPALKRGGKVDRYFITQDDRIMEYDTDAVLFEEKSPYQKVRILHTKSLGNMLVLDTSQNMSERDLIYTETLMQRGKEDYTGKEIVILGGGDGALLYELLKEKPKFVTMLELDEVVIRACREHLRGCCFDCLDQLEGPNYKASMVDGREDQTGTHSLTTMVHSHPSGPGMLFIAEHRMNPNFYYLVCWTKIIIGDCVKYLHKMIEEGKQVDYVFGDLTEIPISTSAQGELWDFLRLILNKATRILRPTGKYLTHGDAACRPEYLALYEDQLRNLQIPVEFTKDVAYIPSFMEDWVFYQVWIKQEK